MSPDQHSLIPAFLILGVFALSIVGATWLGILRSCRKKRGARR